MRQVVKGSKRHRLFAYIGLVSSLLFSIVGVVVMVRGAKGAMPGTLFFGACAAVFAWQLWPKTPGGEAHSVESLLSRYPGPLVMKTPAIQLLAFAAASAIFGGVLLWGLPNEPSAVMQVLLWPLAALLFGSAGLLLVMAVKGSSLHLSRDGFEVVQPWRRKKIWWRDTSEFSLVLILKAMSVVFDDAQAGNSYATRVNKQRTGHSSSLPDAYGLEPEDLAILLNAWRARALRDGAAAQ